METKELKITIPEGYCIDEDKSSFEKIVFKKKEDTGTKPRNWQEYCEFAKATYKHGYMIDDYTCDIDEVDFSNLKEQETENWRNVLPSSKLAKAFLAMMQLMSLRQAWISDWEVDWNDVNQEKAYIICGEGEFTVSHIGRLISRPLSFPTNEMAEEFLDCFKDLLNVAKQLI